MKSADEERGLDEERGHPSVRSLEPHGF